MKRLSVIRREVQSTLSGAPLGDWKERIERLLQDFLTADENPEVSVPSRGVWNVLQEAEYILKNVKPGEEQKAEKRLGQIEHGLRETLRLITKRVGGTAASPEDFKKTFETQKTKVLVLERYFHAVEKEHDVEIPIAAWKDLRKAQYIIKRVKPGEEKGAVESLRGLIDILREDFYKLMASKGLKVL